MAMRPFRCRLSTAGRAVQFRGIAWRAGDPSALHTKPLRLGGVPEHFNYPIRRTAEETGEDAQSFEWQEYAGGSGAMAQALREGDLDCAILLTEAATLFAHRGEVVIVGSYVDTPLCWGVHASADRPPPALDGATFAVSRYGSGSHLMALVDARARGAPPPSFEIVGDMAGARIALKEGRADLFMWEKFTTKPLVDSGEWVRVGEVPTPWPCFTVVMTPTVAKTRAGDVASVFEAIRAYSSVIDASFVDTIAETYALKSEDVSAWMKTVEWAPGTHMSRAIFDKATRALVDAGALSAAECKSYEDVVSELTLDEYAPASA